jgi:hypothetical protein
VHPSRHFEPEDDAVFTNEEVQLDGEYVHPSRHFEPADDVVFTNEEVQHPHEAFLGTIFTLQRPFRLNSTWIERNV